MWFVFVQRVHVTLKDPRIHSAISLPVSVCVCLEHSVVSVNAVWQVTGASPPAVPAPATDTLMSATLTLAAASTAGTIAPDTPVTGTIVSQCVRRLG